MSVADVYASTVPNVADQLRIETVDRQPWILLRAYGDVDSDDTLRFHAALRAGVRRGRGWLVVDLSAVSDFDVLPLAVLAKIRTQAVALGGQLRIIVAEHPVGVLADLNRARWNISSTFAEATEPPWPRLRPVN
jgi:anti-anti-sigma regulatory factor